MISQGTRRGKLGSHHGASGPRRDHLQAAIRVTGRRALAALAVVGLTAGLSAQEQIEPDRPDVTNGTHIVDIGLLQIEMGGLYTRAGAGQRSLGSPFTARAGLTEWLEARVGTDGLLIATDGITRHAGLGNTQLGAKLRLWADPGGVPVLSLLTTVNLPTADRDKDLGSGDADYTLAVLTGTDVGRHWHVDVNYGIGSIGAGNGRPHFAQHLASVSTSVAASDNWNPYIEAFWFSRQEVDGGAIVAMDAGAIYELGSRFALDGGLEFSRRGSTTNVAAFGGLSMVVGNILGNHGVHARQRQLQARAARKTGASTR